VQYINFLQAIDRKESDNIILQTKVLRMAQADKKDYANFLDNIENNNEGIVLTEKDLNEIGFAKKRIVK
jgi:hypothetical protein